MENQAEALQQPAINVTLGQDNTQQVLLSEAELNAGTDFLRAAGLAPTTLAVQGANSRAVTVITLALQTPSRPWHGYRQQDGGVRPERSLVLLESQSTS